MFVAWLKPPWQQITPYIADRRFCAPKMKRNGAKKGRKGGRVKVEKKMTMKKGTMGGGEGVRGEGVGRMWGGVDRAVRPHAALNHARTFFTFRSFNGALLEGLPLWGWRRDFSRSPSGNSRNTTNGSFHPYLRPFVWIAFPISSRDSPLLPPTPPPLSSNRIISRLFLRYPRVYWQLLLESRDSRYRQYSLGTGCIVVSWNCFRIEFSGWWKSRISGS